MPTLTDTATSNGPKAASTATESPPTGGPVSAPVTRRRRLALPLPLWASFGAIAAVTIFATALTLTFGRSNDRILEAQTLRSHEQWVEAGSSIVDEQVAAASEVLRRTYTAGIDLPMGSQQLLNTLLAAGVADQNDLLGLQLIGVANADGEYTGVGISGAAGQIGVASAGEGNTLDFRPWDGGLVTKLPGWVATERDWYNAGVTTPDQIQFVGPTLGLDNRVQYTAALAEPGSGVVWMGTLPAERLARLVDVAWPATGRMHAAAALIDTTSGTGTNYDKIDIEGKVELLGDTEGVPVEVVREAAKKLGTRDQWTDTLTDETGVEWHVTAGNVLPGNHSMAWVVASLAEPPERPDADRYLLVSIGVGAVIAALAALGSALLPARALRRLRNALLTGDTEKLASISTGVSEVNAAADAAAAQTAEAQRRSAEADHRAERLSALHLRTTESTAKANRQLAAELHDGPLQTVLATGLGLGEGPAAEQLATASVELRRITAALTADEFARGGLVARISDVIADIADQPDGRRFNVTLEAPEQVEVDPEVGHVLVRAATELLRNSYKHSGSASAHVRIAATDDLVRLTVADDGVGFTKDPAASNGFGLFSLQVQVEELGGALTIHESSSDGAKVSVAIPPHGRRDASREQH